MQPVLNGLPLGDRHEDQSWPDGRPFLGRQWPVLLIHGRDRRLIIGLIDKLPVEHACPPARLGVQVLAIDNGRVPLQRHKPTLACCQPEVRTGLEAAAGEDAARRTRSGRWSGRGWPGCPSSSGPCWCCAMARTLPEAEVASLLGCSPGTVKTHAHRAGNSTPLSIGARAG